MSDIKRTMTFVGVAVATVVLAVITHFATLPAESTGFEQVGKVFYDGFESSSQATELEVYGVDPDSAELKQFRVEENDGVWTIPSHNDYPAEASERLAKTSSSLIGVKRETLVGRFESDHERFGVIDPLDEDNLNPEGTGKRITLKDRTGEVLVDLIIGKEAEEQDASAAQLAFGQSATAVDYFVRRPDEKQTYKAALDLDLSTKFSDWIKPDLLDLEGAEIRRMVIDNYELEEEKDPLGRVLRLFKKEGDRMQFDRDSGFGPFTMAEMDEDTKQLDSTKLNTAVRTLDNIKIVGVRKKMDYKGQQLLKADLTLNQIDELQQDPRAANQLLRQMQAELADNGFNLAPVAGGNPNELTIVSTAGEMAIGTDGGVAYTMHFGNPVSGDTNDIEIGTTSTDAEPKESKNDEPADDEPTDGQQPAIEDDAVDAADDSSEDDEKVENRFLMIRVSFDESLLGAKPVAPSEPVEPIKPEGYVPAAEETADDGSDPEDAAPAPADGSDSEAGTDAEAKSENQDDRPEAFQEYDRLTEVFNQNKAQYQLMLTQHESAMKEFAQKVENGQKLVSDLNERFGKWFYVISADNLETIQLSKADLVTDKPKVESEIEKPAGLPPRPNIQLNNDIPSNPVTPANNGNDAVEDASDASADGSTESTTTDSGTESPESEPTQPAGDTAEESTANDDEDEEGQDVNEESPEEGGLAVVLAITSHS